MSTSVPTQQSFNIGGSPFNFQATGIGDLGAPEYTLGGVVTDTTGSTASFAAQLREMQVRIFRAANKPTNPRRDYMMLRHTLFSTRYPNGVQEVHGFKELSSINPDTDYPALRPDGATPLWDATFEAIAAMRTYAQELKKGRFPCNGLLVVITDGVEGDFTGEPVSTYRPAQIAAELKKLKSDEALESLITVLIGINAAHYQQKLDEFKRDAGLDHYIDAGDVTEETFAKVARFIEQSMSSQSGALGTGGPSQNILPVI